MTDELSREEYVTNELKQRGITDEVPPQEEEVTNEAPSEKEKILEEASSKGWKPDGPKSAEEFLRAEPLYNEIKARGKEIKELKTAIEGMQSLMAKQQQAGYDQAIEDMKLQRRDAIELGDAEEVEKIDSQIQHLSNEKDNITKPPPASDPIIEDFMSRHQDWIKEDSDEANNMRLLAEAHYILNSNKGISNANIVTNIENVLRSTFPNRFKTEVAVPSPVETGSAEAKSQLTSGKKKYSFNDLSAEQKKICRSLEHSGAMSPEDYIKTLVELKELD
jgi:hypothetical protein